MSFDGLLYDPLGPFSGYCLCDAYPSCLQESWVAAYSEIGTYSDLSIAMCYLPLVLAKFLARYSLDQHQCMLLCSVSSSYLGARKAMISSLYYDLSHQHSLYSDALRKAHLKCEQVCMHLLLHSDSVSSPNSSCTPRSCLI